MTDLEKEKILAEIERLSNWANGYYAHHFDFRGLILMGLALEATEGMYNK